MFIIFREIVRKPIKMEKENFSALIKAVEMEESQYYNTPRQTPPTVIILIKRWRDTGLLPQ